MVTQENLNCLNIFPDLTSAESHLILFHLAR